MCEIEKTSCSCDMGYDKGVLKKTIENNIFTIFGNITQGNSIVIRYHGILTEKEDIASINLFYCFDSELNEKKEILLNKCIKSLGTCYCATIDLDTQHSKLFFGFKDAKGNIDQNQNNLFELKIMEDPITNIMMRYGLDDNKNLPVKAMENHKFSRFLKHLIEKIKSHLTYSHIKGGSF